MKSEGNFKNPQEAIKYLISAPISAAVNSMIRAPIDRVQLILQNQDASIQIKNGKKYTGIFNLIGRVYREQGFLSFYRGNFAYILLKIIPKNILNFMIMNSLKNNLNINKYRSNNYLFFGANFLLGGITGSVNLLMFYPLQYIRVRLALDLAGLKEERQFNNMRDCFRKTYKSDGFLGFYRGCLCSILGIFVYRGFYFGVYELFNNLGLLRRDLLTKFLAAQSTVLIAGICSYPLSTIKGRLMMQNCRPEKQYTNIRECIRHIWKNEGIKGFFKGQLVSISSSIGSALALTIYSSLQSNIGRD